MTHRGLLVDSHGRTLRDLRVSITDRCNFRCMYCLPETEAAANFYRGRWAQGGFHPEPITRQWVPRSKILSFEEIERVVRIAVSLGIEKVRLTGGEPLLRQELDKLVRRIAAIDGLKDLALTTNGFQFNEKGYALREAGLRRISFSLDSLDRENFRKITGRDALDQVLESIRFAQKLGLHPVKVNAVIIREVNDHEIEALARFAAAHGLTMRFIEFMPLDSGRAWMKELVVPGKQILDTLCARFSLDPIASDNLSETAKRWRIRGSNAEIGIIAPVTEPFCGHCNRLRLTADGKIRTCLFSVTEHDLRSRLRGGASDEEIADYLAEVVWDKEPGHRIGQPDFVPASRSMSCIGG
ncbi:MAG: GTP 3',8-cyclase MoaA [Verrucomicrobia subdivision 3 bacterium]|nr:GTP 3',8-cyclase MoaA [Limisphaerales bacterium]